MTLIAYHGDPKLKEFYLRRLRQHAVADEIRHGFYWEGGLGCAVGCTIHGSNHSRYETEIGLPASIAHLEDVLFEMLPNNESKDFTLRFMSAITPGVDVSPVASAFLAWLLSDPEHGVIRFAKSSDVKKIILNVSGLHFRLASGDKPDPIDWRNAESYAEEDDSAAYAAYAATGYAVDAAADAARYASNTAADAVRYSSYTSYTADAQLDARESHAVIMADKLIELLENVSAPCLR